MANHRIIFDSYWTNNLRGVAFTKYNYIENAHNSSNICQINMEDNKINYT